MKEKSLWEALTRGGWNNLVDKDFWRTLRCIYSRRNNGIQNFDSSKSSFRSGFWSFSHALTFTVHFYLQVAHDSLGPREGTRPSPEWIPFYRCSDVGHVLTGQFVRPPIERHADHQLVLGAPVSDPQSCCVILAMSIYIVPSTQDEHNYFF